MAKKPRAQHRKKTKADTMRELFGKMSQEQLKDTSELNAAVKRAKLKTNSSDIYRIRNEFLTGESNSESSETDVLRNILTVKRTAIQVGGLPNLKLLISIIERVQQ